MRNRNLPINRETEAHQSTVKQRPTNQPRNRHPPINREREAHQSTEKQRPTNQPRNREPPINRETGSHQSTEKQRPTNQPRNRDPPINRETGTHQPTAGEPSFLRRVSSFCFLQEKLFSFFVLCAMFDGPLVIFLLFFDVEHCIVNASSIYVFWLPIWYLENFVNVILTTMRPWQRLPWWNPSCMLTNATCCRLWHYKVKKELTERSPECLLLTSYILQ
jgi:hypothetical protein